MERMCEVDGRTSSLAASPSTSTMKPEVRQRWPSGRPLPRFERRTFSGSSGSRDYRLYVPATPTRGPRSLLVMLHGCTQTALLRKAPEGIRLVDPA